MDEGDRLASSGLVSVPSFKKVSKGEVRGWITEDLIDLLPPAFFEDAVSSVQEMGGVVLKASRRRWAAIFTLRDRRRVFIKKDKASGWLPALKYRVLPSKGRKEFLIADRLQGSPVPIPKPLGWMEWVRSGVIEESYYLCEAIGSGTSFIESCRRSEKKVPAGELAKAVRKIHDSGLFHKDFHAGNFLWDGESFFITDLHRAAVVRTLSKDQKLWNLAQLFHSLRSVWEEEDRILFIETYFGKEAAPLQEREEFLRRVHLAMDRLQKRQWRSRTKRCLKESTEFSTQKEKAIRYYHRRDFDLDRAKRLIETHLCLVKENPSTLAKQSPEIMVSILYDGEDRVCVKQFRYARFRDRLRENFRRSKGLKAWVSGNGLKARAIASVRLLAFVEKRDWLGLRESYLLMEAPDGDQEMDRYLSRGFKDPGEKRLFIETSAQWLVRLHQTEIYHQDLKTCNILVSKKGVNWEFRLIDLEDIRLDRKVNERELLRNLVQLNSSAPRVITRTDRIRFFRSYLRSNPIVKKERIFLKRLVRATHQRGLVYVSPSGVVAEKW